MKQTLLGDPDSAEDDAENVVNQQDELWNAVEVMGGALVTYNCCAYVIGETPGLTESDWISPTALGATEYTVPMTVLLNGYFKLIYAERLETLDGDALARSHIFMDGDIFCFVDSKTGEKEFAHVGKISPRNGKKWMLSKLGRGPIVRPTIKTTVGIFRDHFEQIRVSRRLPKSS